MNKLIDLKGKTIKFLNPYYYDGVLIEFTDGIIVSIKTPEYPEGGYRDAQIEEEKRELVKEYLEEKK